MQALQLSYSSLLTSLKLTTRNNQIIDPTYIEDRACKTETLLNCQVPYTSQNSLTFYYNVVFVLLHNFSDQHILFSFYKGYKELSDVRLK